jgi:hypothetical protein
MAEAVQFKSAKQLRYLFAYILIGNVVTKKTVQALWTKYKPFMSDDFFQKNNSANAQNLKNRKCYFHVNSILQDNDSDLSVYDLDESKSEPVESDEGEDLEQQNKAKSKYDEDVQFLNAGQRLAIAPILDGINGVVGSNKHFFVDGPGGNGKTYL